MALHTLGNKKSFSKNFVYKLRYLVKVKMHETIIHRN